MSTIVMEMTLDEARVIAALKRVIDQQNKTEDGVTKVGKKYDEAGKQAERSARELERFARRTTELNTTPIERYNAQLTRLDAALKAGKISQETFNRAASAAKKELTDAGQASESTFGNQAISQLGNFAGGIGAITAALGATKQAFESVAEARQKALQSSESLNNANRDLASLYTTPEDFAAGLRERDTYARRYGITRDEASKTLFTAKSGNFSGEDTRTAFESALVTDPQLASQLMLKSQEMYGGQISRRQALNVAFKAAADSPLEVKDIAQYLPTAGVSAKAAGFSYEDTTALLTTLTERFKGPEQAADRLGTFMSRLALTEDKRGFAGLQSLVTDENAARAFAGDSKELNEVLRVLKDDLAKAQRRSVSLREESARSGQADDAVSRAIAVRFSDPAERAKLIKRQSEIAAEVERDQRFTPEEAMRQAAIERGQAQIESQRRGMAYRTAAGAAGYASGFLGLGASTTAAVQGAAGNLLEGLLNPRNLGTTGIFGGASQAAAMLMGASQSVNYQNAAISDDSAAILGRIASGQQEQTAVMKQLANDVSQGNSAMQSRHTQQLATSRRAK